VIHELNGNSSHLFFLTTLAQSAPPRGEPHIAKPSGKKMPPN
jgi:hypothetical protein